MDTASRQSIAALDNFNRASYPDGNDEKRALVEAVIVQVWLHNHGTYSPG